jgi:BirA family biotin operon repressor/biotin-[acetyl-CoA-carboxylase] ligase
MSPAGNLAASLLLCDPAPLVVAPQLGFVAGVALVDAIQACVQSDLARKVQIKWPNDLVVEGAKVSGLLLEATQVNGRTICVIGFGVNMVAHPPGLPYAATSLGAAGMACGAAELLKALARSMEIWLTRWKAGENFAAVRSAWLEHAAGLDQKIRVASGAGDIEGMFRGINHAGQLILETENGQVTMAAGDVFLAHAPQGRKPGE